MAREPLGRSWLPWRGQSPVLWTLALTLGLLAVSAAAVLPARGRSPFLNRPVPALASWAALLALGLALWASMARQDRTVWSWPWRGPDPVRNTVAFALKLVALAVLFLGRVDVRIAFSFSLIFVSTLVSARDDRWNRMWWCFLAGAFWYLWYLE